MTPDVVCSHEIKRYLLLGRKAMTNLDGILKHRDITVLTKIHLVKVMVSPVVTKKAEYRRIDPLELWCWRRLSRVPLTARRFSQSILKEIYTEYSLEGLMLKLKLQYFGHLTQRADSLVKTLMRVMIEGRRRRGWRNKVAGWNLQVKGHEFEQTPEDSERQESLGCCSSPRVCKESDTTKQLNSSNKNKTSKREHPCWNSVTVVSNH